MFPITDAHQHLWDLGLLRLDWLEDVPQLNRSFLFGEYRTESADLGILRSVYVEVDVVPEQRRLEVESVARLCRDPATPLSAIVAAADPGGASFQEDIERFAEVPEVRGVRRVLHTPATPKGYCLGSRFVEGARELGRRSLVFDICMRPSELIDAARLVELCPETQFVIDHCGNADPAQVALWRQVGSPRGDAEPLALWLNGMEALAAHPNVTCKLSGIAARLPEEESLDRLEATLDYCIELFGVERVMFGSDWPVCTLRVSLRKWVSAARKAFGSRTPAEQQLILDANAARVYRLG